MGSVTTVWLQVLLACRNILSRNHSLEHLQRSQWLVERYFVARLVDSHKAEQVTLTDLSVNNAIRGSDVHKACVFVTLRIDLFGDDLSTKPVAVEVTRTQISTVWSFITWHGRLTHLRNTAKPVLQLRATSSHSQLFRTRGRRHLCFQRHCSQYRKIPRNSGMLQ